MDLNSNSYKPSLLTSIFLNVGEGIEMVSKS